MNPFFVYALIGFAAQLIAGTMGMAYGVTASTLLLAMGVVPASISATVHAAEIFTTGASGLAHRYFGNVNRHLFWRLTLPGVAGAVLGAYVLTRIPGAKFAPFIALYQLAMGALILLRALRIALPVRATSRVAPLGFFGAVADAIGGGGFGTVVTSTLMARGNDARQTVGTVQAAKFLVTLAASITFFLTIGLSYWQVILGLAAGGAVAAPIGAYACSRISHKPFMILVGALVIAVSLRTLILAISG